jgi:hypothetical protein
MKHCRNGRTHGVARQWSDDGTLIGTYKMKRGAGIDLWWLNEDQGSVSEERHFRNPGMRLRRGFPKCRVNGERASKRQYRRG